MLISIFENIIPYPKDREEKRVEASKLGEYKDKSGKIIREAILPKLVEVFNEDELINVVMSNAWSPFVFNGRKLQDNFVSTDFATLDIDDGLTIQEAEKRILESNTACLCLPSTSHTNEHHRFRLIFPLSKTIKSRAIYVETMKMLAEHFPEADESCVTDTARFYFASRITDGFWLDGDFIEPIFPEKKNLAERQRNMIKVDENYKDMIDRLYGVDRGMIPEKVAYFVENAHTGLHGEWITTLNSCVYTLALSGLEEEEIRVFIAELAPAPLDERDEKHIKIAFRDGSRDRE